MALLIRDAKIIQKLDDGNLHDVPSMVLLREIVASFESTLAEEKAERIAADNELRDMILKEIADRITGDNNLQTAIDTEKSERIAADNDLSQQISNERAERIAADDSEKEAREADVTNINNRIDNLTFEDILGMLPGTRVWAYGE